MPAESIGDTSARIISLAKAARRKLRVAKPKPMPLKHIESKYFSRCPAMAAFMRTDGRNKGGRVRWLLSGAEMRYLVAVGAFTNKDGFCKASQRKLAAELGVSRRMVGRWEAGLVAKGFLESVTISRQAGRWAFRILRVIYPEKPRPVTQDPQVEGGGYPGSGNQPGFTSGALMANETEERLEVAR